MRQRIASLVAASLRWGIVWAIVLAGIRLVVHWTQDRTLPLAWHSFVGEWAAAPWAMAAIWAAASLGAGIGFAALARRGRIWGSRAPGREDRRGPGRRDAP